MANACGPGCGYCGRCTDRHEWQREYKPIDVCDRDGCMRTINTFGVSIQGLGQFCSRRCADEQRAALEQAS